jgi:recombination protein RecT
MANEVAKIEKSLTVKQMAQSETIKKKFSDMLGKRANQFLVSVIGVVQQNTMLQKADPNSIFMAAATAASLDLPVDSNLGFSYIVPYNTKGLIKAQFQIGAKGFIQLAIRSGQFKYINSSDVREGEILRNNRLTGQIEFDWKNERDQLPIVGYVSYFKLSNGFESTLYMTVEELQKHGRKYSKSYDTGNWTTNFPSMALKTVTKLNLSKNAPLSVEMQTAIQSDQSVISEDGYSYPDNMPTDAHELAEMKEIKRTSDYINSCESLEALEKAELHLINYDLKEQYEEKRNQIMEKEIEKS